MAKLRLLDPSTFPTYAQRRADHPRPARYRQGELLDLFEVGSFSGPRFRKLSANSVAYQADGFSYCVLTRLSTPCPSFIPVVPGIPNEVIQSSIDYASRRSGKAWRASAKGFSWKARKIGWRDVLFRGRDSKVSVYVDVDLYNKVDIHGDHLPGILFDFREPGRPYKCSWLAGLFLFLESDETIRRMFHEEEEEEEEYYVEEWEY